MIRVLKPAKLITVFTIFLTLLFVFTTVVAAYHVRIPRVLPVHDATPAASKKEQIQQKLSEVKLKICESVESRIKTRSTGMATRAENMTTRFTKIADRVEEYYTNKLLPKGAVVENYDALVANVAAHEADVNNAVANTQSTISSFDCEANNPKGQLTQFKDEMKKVITALKEYRTSVVDLLVAVRTKAKNIKSPSATSSAQPATGSAEPE